MKSNTITTAPTYESVMATLQQVARMQEELTQSQKETDKIVAESRKEIAESRKEIDVMLKELTESQKETEKLLKETIAQSKKNMDDYEKSLARQAKMTNGVSESYGSFAEEYFYNSFYYGDLNFFGEKFDDVQKNRTGPNPGEYDIMLFNCKAVAVIEVKFKVREKYLSEVLKKEKTFRLNFPEYNDCRLYLGIAAMVFDPEIEKEFIDNGIAVIKQVGDKVVINDENLKAF